MKRKRGRRPGGALPARHQPSSPGVITARTDGIGWEAIARLASAIIAAIILIVQRLFDK